MTDSIQTDTPADRRADALKHEINEARGDIMETINAIQDRFRPRRILSRASQSVASGAAEAVDEVKRLQREHPIDVSRWTQQLARHPVAAGAVAGALIAVMAQMLRPRRNPARRPVRSS